MLDVVDGVVVIHLVTTVEDVYPRVGLSDVDEKVLDDNENGDDTNICLVILECKLVEVDGVVDGDDENVPKVYDDGVVEERAEEVIGVVVDVVIAVVVVVVVDVVIAVVVDVFDVGFDDEDDVTNLFNSLDSSDTPSVVDDDRNINDETLER